MSESQAFFRRIVLATIHARQQEQSSISKFLHDEVGQVLTAVGLHLGVLRLDFRDKVPEIVPRINEIQDILDQAIQQVRSLSYDLNPAVVERAGLNPSLDRMLGRFRARFAGTIRFQFDQRLKIPLSVANAWYKITEQALENAVRHSGGTVISVQLKVTAKGAVLEVKDDGKGFIKSDAAAEPAGLGLMLIEHHSGQAGLSTAIESSPNKGTVLRSTYIQPIGSEAE